VMPLLEAIHSLIKFAQLEDVFVISKQQWRSMKGMRIACSIKANSLLKVKCSIISKLWSILPMKTSIYIGLQIWTCALIIWVLNLLANTYGPHYVSYWCTYFCYKGHIWRCCIREATMLKTTS
jgi:hypothetical protein